MTFSEREHDRDSLMRWHTLTESAEMLGISGAALSRYVRLGVVKPEIAFGASLLHDEDVAFLDARRKSRL